MKAIWLFRFTAYEYCQGTRDRYEDMRLLTLTLPCDESEARHILNIHLTTNKVEYDKQSITCLNVNITNS